MACSTTANKKVLKVASNTLTDKFSFNKTEKFTGKDLKQSLPVGPRGSFVTHFRLNTKSRNEGQIKTADTLYIRGGLPTVRQRGIIPSQAFDTCHGRMLIPTAKLWQEPNSPAHIETQSRFVLEKIILWIQLINPKLRLPFKVKPIYQLLGENGNDGSFMLCECSF